MQVRHRSRIRKASCGSRCQGGSNATGVRCDRLATKAELYWDPADDRGAALVAGASAALRPIAVFRVDDAQMWMMRGPAVPRETYTLYAVRDTIRRVLSVDVASC